MKCVLFFAGIVLFQMISTAYGKKEFFNECAKELGITEAALKEAREQKKDKPEFRCLGACMLKKIGELEEGNKMNWDKVEENASKHFGDKSNDIVKVKQECVEESKAIADECDFVKAVHKCLFEKIPDMRKYMKG
ncbi:uncharacterized protein LOC127277045 [Leptopilina boulardi]|uniref:uncharacterized protein LOC127277045 n=1 Tax=Leptopilina boulardi TaxID=63433 RepID=UPI0021F6615A|nr:uncharacterized protein LOC127277045 [Leptopilina boulardi]